MSLCQLVFVVFVAWEPAFELGGTFTSEREFNHKSIYIIQVDFKCVYYIIKTWHYIIHQDTHQVDLKRLHRARTRAGSN